MLLFVANLPLHLSTPPPPSPITRQHHACRGHAPQSQCGFLCALPSAKDIFCVEHDPRVHVNHLRWQFQLRRVGNLRQTKGFCLDAAVVVGSWAEVMRSPAVIKCFYLNSAGLPERVERADDRLTTVRACCRRNPSRANRLHFSAVTQSFSSLQFIPWEEKCLSLHGCV